MRLFKIRSIFSCEAGASFIETLVILAVLGTVAVVFLNGITISSRAVFITDEQATAESLARSQMEWALNTLTTPYVDNATGYSSATIPSGNDYLNYSVNITAEPLNTPDDGIQKITVSVIHSDKQIITLESYKVDR